MNRKQSAPGALIDAISPLVDEVDPFGTTTLGMMTGMVPKTTMDLIGSAVSRINSYTQSLDYGGWERIWASLRGESVDQGVLNAADAALLMKLLQNPEMVALIKTLAKHCSKPPEQSSS